MSLGSLQPGFLLVMFSILQSRVLLSSASPCQLHSYFHFQAHAKCHSSFSPHGRYDANSGSLCSHWMARLRDLTGHYVPLDKPCTSTPHPPPRPPPPSQPNSLLCQANLVQDINIMLKAMHKNGSFRQNLAGIPAAVACNSCDKLLASRCCQGRTFTRIPPGSRTAQPDLEQC